METTEIQFVQSIRGVGLLRAQEILHLLMAYYGNVTKVVRSRNKNLEPMTVSLSKKELSTLDKDLQLTHAGGDSHTPVLDRVGDAKPNMTQELINYYTNNPGHTVMQGARAMAQKHMAHYGDEETGYKKVCNLINTIAYAKGAQRHLEKRGGFPGRGGAAQVFVTGR